MGLGKSLQSLMLVLSNPAPPGWAATSAAPMEVEQEAEEVEEQVGPGAAQGACV